ncbi:hypothetical protein B1H10_07830 [candidate division KSB1 bacterium 4484_188]|nr:MAG: hypothetical protein B1H10_07830 [candidate division KSB1 bacterium 4484_188]
MNSEAKFYRISRNREIFLLSILAATVRNEKRIRVICHKIQPLFRLFLKKLYGPMTHQDEPPIHHPVEYRFKLLLQKK